jgi:hypothetical protein
VALKKRLEIGVIFPTEEQRFSRCLPALWVSPDHSATAGCLEVE